MAKTPEDAPGQPGCFGGPVNMPAPERLAKGGLRYNNMHTAPVGV